MEEEIIIPLIFFSFLALFVKMILDYKKEKAKFRYEQHSAPDKSLGMSELRAMIREAVQEANAPLAARLEALEVFLEAWERDALPEGRQEKLLGAPPEREGAEETASRRHS